MTRWITGHLGTSAWDQVEQLPDIHLVDVREMVDKDGNAPVIIKSKIDEALNYLQQGKKVVICCDYGMSRSNAIAAGVLVLGEGMSLEAATRRVLEATGETAIRVEVLSAVRKTVISAPDTPPVEHRLLVTGASGFIGTLLVDKLKPTYEVFAPTQQEIDLTRDTIALDLLVKEQGVGAIIHLANPRVRTTNQSLGVALVMLKNVLDVCAANQLYLIYLSSWEVYSGYKSQELSVDEGMMPYPGGTTGQTKALCEMLIKNYEQRYQIPCLILRPGSVYGPENNRPRFIWNFLNKALDDQEIVTHKYVNGFPKLDMLHIDDLLTAIVLAIGHRAQGKVNLGTGIGTSTTKMAEYIVDLVGSASKIHHINIEEYASNIILDNRQAFASLGWRPTIDLVQGLKSIVKCVNENSKERNDI